MLCTAYCIRTPHQAQNYSSPFPLPYINSFVNFTALSLGSPSCYTKRRFDYIDRMMVETLAPICFAVFLVLLFRLTVFVLQRQYDIDEMKLQREQEQQRYMEDGERITMNGDTFLLQEPTNGQPAERPYMGLSRQSQAKLDTDVGRMISRYFSLFLLITYLVLPSVTTTIAGAVPTINIDPDGLTGQPQHFMRNDLNISANSNRYRFGIIWAAIFIVVYPIGVPLLYFYVLFCNRKEIRAKDEVVLDEAAANAANGASASATEGQIGREVDEPVSASFLGRQGDHLSPLDSQRSISGRLIGSVSLVTRCCMLILPSRTDIMSHIRPNTIFFLHGAYEGQFWYWEVLETLRRILLTAVMSVVSPGKLHLYTVMLSISETLSNISSKLTSTLLFTCAFFLNLPHCIN
jgi:hypothetical protein